MCAEEEPAVEYEVTLSSPAGLDLASAFTFDSGNLELTVSGINELAHVSGASYIGPDPVILNLCSTAPIAGQCATVQITYINCKSSIIFQSLPSDTSIVVSDPDPSFQITLTGDLRAECGTLMHTPVLFDDTSTRTAGDLSTYISYDAST